MDGIAQSAAEALKANLGDVAVLEDDTFTEGQRVAP